MIFYVYFDSYGHARQAINEDALNRKYHGDPDKFLKAVQDSGGEQSSAHAAGHVGTLRFENEDELEEFLASLGDEISGFYGCRSESRPYNF